MSMKESKAFWSRKRPRGQSIIEFALMAPILLILLSGLFEFGFIFTNYLAVLDAARNAARFSSDSQYNISDGNPCATTNDFYRYTACMAVVELAQEQPTITLCVPGAPITEKCTTDWNERDDIVISVFSVLRDNSKKDIVRFPESTGEYGWSYDYDLMGYSQSGNIAHRTGMHFSNYSSDDIKGKLKTGTPNTGYVLVEIKYHYHEMLGLPWFQQIVSDPIHFNIFAMWPCVSAEPTTTL
jgi:hypothetical protein